MGINDVNAGTSSVNWLSLCSAPAVVPGLSLVVSPLQIFSATSRAASCRGLLILRWPGQRWKMFSWSCRVRKPSIQKVKHWLPFASVVSLGFHIFISFNWISNKFLLNVNIGRPRVAVVSQLPSVRNIFLEKPKWLHLGFPKAFKHKN